MQLVDGAHQRQILLWRRHRQVIHVRPRDLQQLRLPLHWQRVRLDDHRFALASPTRPSATSKKSTSSASCPILACISFAVGPCSVPRFSAGDRNTPIAPSSNCVFHCTTWLACTSYFSASSASVLSPFSAANATFALNVAVWFLLGLFITAPLSGNPFAHKSRFFT